MAHHKFKSYWSNYSNSYFSDSGFEELGFSLEWDFSWAEVTSVSVIDSVFPGIGWAFSGVGSRTTSSVSSRIFPNNWFVSFWFGACSEKFCLPTG